MDFPELRALDRDAGWAYPRFGTMLVLDTFLSCSPPAVPHGTIVAQYMSLAADVDVVTAQRGSPWQADLPTKVLNHGPGTVANLSISNSISNPWGQGEAEGVDSAYAHNVLLVFPLPATLNVNGNNRYLQASAGKFLICHGIEGDAGQAADVTWPFPNLSAVSIATHDMADLTVPGSNPGPDASYPDEVTNSFSTALLSGSLRSLVDIVGSRSPAEPFSVDRVLDYVISSCDRTIGTQTFAHRLHERVRSFGPWSDSYGYGIFSPWKALLYAAGFGDLAALDTQLGAASNPPAVFSDNFDLRGDLRVPAGQSLIVSRLGGLQPYGGTAAGPNWGDDPARKEIVVEGAMTIQSDPTLEGVYPDGTKASVVLRSPAVCTVGTAGVLTIGPGDVLHVGNGTVLIVQGGGELRVRAGAQVVVDVGGEIRIEAAGKLALDEDLMIPIGATLTAGAGAIVTAGSGVDIDCVGTLALSGTALAPVSFRGKVPGPNSWGTLTYEGYGADVLSHVDISDATTGLTARRSVTLTACSLHECGTGVLIANTSGITLDGLSVHDCGTGLRVVQSTPVVKNSLVYRCTTGIECGISGNPTVRGSTIYANQVGLSVPNGDGLPDLGTLAAFGRNDFRGPGHGYPGDANVIHVYANDPASDIQAIGNWWGTTDEAAIRARIVVLDSPPLGAGTVVIRPILCVPPAQSTVANLTRNLSPPVSCVYTASFTWTTACSTSCTYVVYENAVVWKTGSTPVGVDHAAAVTGCRTGRNYKIDVTDGGPPSSDKWGIKDCIQSLAGSIAKVAGRMLSVSPNPVASDARISLRMAESGSVSVRIFDVQGRIVRTIVDGRLGAGDHEFVWNREGVTGRRVGAGIYFAVLRAGDSFELRRLMVR
jgi:hypothetical protein